MKLDPYLTLFIKINPKQIKDLTIRPKTIQFLEEENIGENLHGTGLGNDFLGIAYWVTKAKIGKIISNLKTFVHPKDTINRVKSNLEWEKYFLFKKYLG